MKKKGQRGSAWKDINDRQWMAEIAIAGAGTVC